MPFLLLIMAIEMTEREPKSTVLNPLEFSSATRLSHYAEFHNTAIQVNRELSLMQQTVDRQINVDGPIQLVPIGDTHLFSTYTEIDAVKKTLELLEKDNAFGFVTGDFIEAQHPFISEHTGSVLLNTGKQIVAASDYLLPYFYAGKILCTVNGYFGHDGSWSLKYGGIPAVEFMSRIMPMPDMNDPRNPDKWKYLPVLEQGGLLRLYLKGNRRPYVVRLFHDPSGGGSDNINRSGSLKRQFMDESDNYSMNGVQVDMYVAGHQHHRGTVAKEMYIDRMDRKEKSVVFVQIGTAKGIKDENKDPFLTGQGKGPSIGPGPVIFVSQAKVPNNEDIESTKEIVAWGYENTEIIEGMANMLHSTKDQLNTIERQHLTSELIEKVSKRVKKPTVEFDSYGSGRDTMGKPGKAPLFNEVRWRIKGYKDYPLLVYSLANARYGSSSRENPIYKRKYDEILEQTIKNPFRYIIAGRAFIDDNVSKRADREEILGDMIADLGPINDQQSLLGFMMSKPFLEDGWQKDVSWTENVWNRQKRKYDKIKHVSEHFLPGDRMYYDSALKGVPLFGNDSFIRIEIDGTPYYIQAFDKLGNSGSEFYLGRGLVQSRRKGHTDPDVVTGGHMQLAGSLIYPPKPIVYLPTGHLSAYIGGGTKGNKRNVVTGGQAFIIFPKRKLVLPEANYYEATDNFNALFLNMGLTDQEKKKLNTRTR